LFDIGFQELLMICVVALLVVGPQRLPELGRTLGKRLRELKRALDSVKAQVTAEMKELGKEAEDNEPISRPTPRSGPMLNSAEKSELTAGGEES
jgi:Tat protein translocase TatB subunit